MIQLGLILVLVTGLLAAGMTIIHQVKESGRAECRAEHQEAARMAELRARERGDTASRKFEAERASIDAKRAAAERAVESTASNGACLSDGVLNAINDHLREARGAGESVPAVPGPTGHPGQK